jgi:hypothetical protein
MFKIRLSKPNYDISDSNLNNIVYDSEYDTLKYYTSGSVNLVVDGANVETTITHDLGYIPFYVVYLKNPVFTTRYSMTPFAYADFGVYGYLSAYADSTKLYFTAHTNSLTATVVFLYKIFINDLEL